MTLKQKLFLTNLQDSLLLTHLIIFQMEVVQILIVMVILIMATL